MVADGVLGWIRLEVHHATFTRLIGINGYEIAHAVARAFAAGGTVYVATGDVVADGLAGGAVAS